jgi:hypothetical protein
VSVVGIGGWRGWLGVLVIALILGLGYASLLSTILGQWAPQAGTPVGLLVLAVAGWVLILVWLLGAIMR